MSGDTLVTVNVSPSAMTALRGSAARTGDTLTSTLNRALELYAHVVDLAENGGGGINVDLFVWRTCNVVVAPDPSVIDSP